MASTSPYVCNLKKKLATLATHFMTYKDNYALIVRMIVKLKLKTLKDIYRKQFIYISRQL